MNIDDPKLTAFALDELDEPERSAIAREVAESAEAQHMVGETRDLARALRDEFAAEMANEKPAAASARRDLCDIRDDPWFWTIGRRLAIAASLAIFAILGAVIIAKYDVRRKASSPAAADYAFVEEDRKQQTTTESPDHVANPMRADVVSRIDSIVVGEIVGDSTSEIRMIENIKDAYRVQRLKRRLSTPVVSKKSARGLAARRYELMFLDRGGRLVASAAFYYSPQAGFVMQPVKSAYERSGQYFLGGDSVLPGDWRSDIDYQEYVIPFPDWLECVGYAPGA